jgi:hypothetical protein
MQMKAPVMYVSGIHFDSITDLAWSKDGQFLIASSKDGYCSMIEFAAGELGEPLEQEFLPPVVAKVSFSMLIICPLHCSGVMRKADGRHEMCNLFFAKN